MLKPAMVVVTSGADLLARAVQWRTHSPWDHALLVLGPDLAIEAQWERGVRECSLDYRLEAIRNSGGKRHYAVLDLPWMMDAERDLVCAAARSHLYHGYGYAAIATFLAIGHFVTPGSHRPFCSSLIWNSFQKGIGVRVTPKFPTAGMLVTDSVFTVVESTRPLQV
jgi:hypothetical protein